MAPGPADTVRATVAAPTREEPRGAEPFDSAEHPRPPEGDWLGTPYLRFERQGPIAVCTIDRPDARNALSPAMYFGIRYAVGRLNEDPDLAGLVLTGTGDVFAPGGDMGGGEARTTGSRSAPRWAWT